METPPADAAMWSGMPDTPPAPPFKTARRGFEQQQVLEYVAQMTDRLQTVENMVRQLRAETERAQHQRDAALLDRDAVVQERDAFRRERDAALLERSSDADGYEHVSGRVTELLVALDRDVETIRAEAEAEAEQIVIRARSEAYRLRGEAEEAQAEAMLAARAAREEAERSEADMASRRDVVLDELRRTCNGFLGVVANLEASIRSEEDDAEQGNDSEGKATAKRARDGRDNLTVVLPDVMPDRPA